jgi:hypothetical protein
MKYATAVIAIALMAVFPLNSYAACPNINGPYSCCGLTWYDYTPDTSCAGTSGNVSPATLWCYSTPAKQFGSGSSSVTYSFTIGQNDPVLNSWSVDLRYVEWSDPNASIYNTLSATVSVTHNGSTSSQTFYSINGQTTQSCALSSYATFSATHGDTIAVTINATIYNSNVTAQGGAPHVFTQS